jgi:hypothetical protein
MDADGSQRLTSLVEPSCLLHLTGVQGRVPTRHAGSVEVIQNRRAVDVELCREVVDRHPSPVGRRQFPYLWRQQTALPPPRSGFSSYRWSETASTLFQHNGVKLGNLRPGFMVRELSAHLHHV